MPLRSFIDKQYKADTTHTLHYTTLHTNTKYIQTRIVYTIAHYTHTTHKHVPVDEECLICFSRLISSSDLIVKSNPELLFVGLSLIYSK